MKLVMAGETVAARRRVYFHLTGTDGVTPVNTEAGGQPQLSDDGAAWTDAGIGVLVLIGNGRYYATLTSGAVATAGHQIETRYKSSNTAECPGDSVLVTVWDPYDPLAAIDPADVTLADLVQRNGDWSARRGRDYYAADGRALEWTDPGTWPDLSTATAFTMYTYSAGGDGEYPMSLVAGATQKVRLELSAAQTQALATGPAGRAHCAAVATLADGHSVELFLCVATVTRY